MASRSKGWAAAPKAGASSDSWLSELKSIRARLQSLEVAPAPAEDGGDSDDEFALLTEDAPQQAVATGAGPDTDADLLTASVHRALTAARSSAAGALVVADEAFLWRDGPRAWMAAFADRVRQEADTPVRIPPICRDFPICREPPIFREIPGRFPPPPPGLRSGLPESVSVVRFHLHAYGPCSPKPETLKSKP